MTRPVLPRFAPLLAALLTTAGLVACGDASDSTLGSYHVKAKSGSSTGSGSSSTGSGSSGTTPGTGSGSNGATPGAASGTPATGGTSGNPDPGTGGTPGTPDPTPAAPAFDVAVDNAAPSLALADTATVQVTVTPQSYTGNVTLSVTGAPSDVTATFDNAMVAVTGTTPAMATLTLKSITGSVPTATPITIVATAGVTTKSSPVTLTVKPELTIKIPVNVDANGDQNTFGTINIAAPADIQNNPVKILFLNQDSTPHEIHAGKPNEGFPHGDGTFGQNQLDPKKRNVIATGSYDFYLHDQGGPQTPGTIVIQ